MMNDNLFYADLKDTINLLSKATFEDGADGVKYYLLETLLSAEKIPVAQESLSRFCDDFDAIPSYYYTDPSVVRENKNRFSEICDLFRDSFVKFFSYCGHPPDVLNKTLITTKRDINLAYTIPALDPLFSPLAEAIDHTASTIKPAQLRESLIDILKMERDAHPIAAPVNQEHVFMAADGKTLSIRLMQQKDSGLIL